MITWMTMGTYGKTAKTLEREDLEIQREEVLHIVNWLIEEDSDCDDDDLVLGMWSGFEYALCIYGMFICMEWIRRGIVDEIFWKLGNICHELGDSYQAPPWIKDKDVIRSHRSNLMRYDPDKYGKLFKGTPENMPIIYPVIHYGEDGEPEGYNLYVNSEEKKLLVKGKRKLPSRIRERIVNL